MFDLRIAAPPDARGIAEVHVATWRSAYRGLVAPRYLDGLDANARVTQWQRILSEVPAERRHWVAASGGLTVGFASAGPARDEDLDATGELYALYVSPEHWCQGIGAALLDAALTFVRTQGRPRVSLWVLADNDRARRFYERAAFAPDGATRRHLYGETELSSIRYVRTLSER